MEWNKQELEFLQEHRKVIDDGNFTDIRVELFSYDFLDTQEKKHLLMGIAVVTDIDIVVEVLHDFRTRLMLVDREGNKQRIAINDYTHNPDTEQMRNDYGDDLFSIGCSPDLIKKVFEKMEIRFV